jgi:hypothetical protein
VKRFVWMTPARPQPTTRVEPETVFRGAERERGWVLVAISGGESVKVGLRVLAEFAARQLSASQGGIPQRVEIRHHCCREAEGAVGIQNPSMGRDPRRRDSSCLHVTRHARQRAQDRARPEVARPSIPARYYTRIASWLPVDDGEKPVAGENSIQSDAKPLGDDCLTRSGIRSAISPQFTAPTCA